MSWCPLSHPEEFLCRLKALLVWIFKYKITGWFLNLVCVKNSSRRNIYDVRQQGVSYKLSKTRSFLAIDFQNHLDSTFLVIHSDSIEDQGLNQEEFISQKSFWCLSTGGFIQIIKDTHHFLAIVSINDGCCTC